MKPSLITLAHPWTSKAFIFYTTLRWIINHYLIARRDFIINKSILLPPFLRQRNWDWEFIQLVIGRPRTRIQTFLLLVNAISLLRDTLTTCHLPYPIFHHFFMSLPSIRLEFASLSLRASIIFYTFSFHQKGLFSKVPKREKEVLHRHLSNG